MGLRGLIFRLLGSLGPATIKRINSWQWSGPWARRVVHWGSRWVRNQDITIRFGVGKGLAFNTGNSSPGYAFGTSEPMVQEALAALLKEGDVFYDIGANVGFYAIIAAKLVGPAGHVYAFEPVPENAAALRHNVDLNRFRNVTVLEKAVSDSPGKATLYLATEPIWARLEAAGARPDTTGSITVDLVSIDELVTSQMLPPPTVVKIDVEGSEVAVLSSMQQTMAAYKPTIVCEPDGNNVAIGALLRARGYDLRTLEVPLPVEEAPWWVHVIATPRAGDG